MEQQALTACILIIDDEESILDGCRQALTRWGHKVATASDGSEAVKLAREIRPDMAFIDLKLPGLSGMDVLDILSRDIPDIILVVITGHASIVSAVEAMHKGAYDYLPKPFIPDQLRAVTQRGLEHRALKIEARKLKEERESFEKNFITFVSHEMRSPLVTIEQYIETIRFIGGESLPKDIFAIIERCEKRIKNLEELVEHWLDLSRIESGSYSRDMRPLDLKEVITWSVDDLAPLCERRDITVSTDIPPDLPRISGDAESLIRVMINIIGNATKYTPAGGKISIRAAYDDYYVTVSIADTGMGIPAEKLPLIFEPFYRARGKEERHRGSGLGLTFCKKIMDAHHGRIEATSKLGAGTTFILTFPR